MSQAKIARRIDKARYGRQSKKSEQQRPIGRRGFHHGLLPLTLLLRGSRSQRIGRRCDTHSRIDNAAILSPSRVKKKGRSIGLPGKLPVSRQVTTVSLPCAATPIASRVKL